MPSGSFSKRARNTDSVINKKNCGGNKKGGLSPRATGRTQFRNVAMNQGVNFKIHKGGLPCPTNYSNNPGGQCAGGVGALASTRSRGCNNLTICKKTSNNSCPPASLEPYVGNWRVTDSQGTIIVDLQHVDVIKTERFTSEELNNLEQSLNATIVGDTIVISGVQGFFAKLNVPNENCDKIYFIIPDNEGVPKFEANPVEFSFTNPDNETYTYTKTN
ncbi:MAG: hypothetical protein ACW98D_21240 [Promethearchaeota archaeon]|jgi:hypothetical protein